MAATNRNLREAAERGELREDLYYRLDGAPVHIDPPLERPEDIIPLVHQFLHEFSIGATTPMTKIAPESESILLAHRWKGNVRELRNADATSGAASARYAFPPTVSPSTTSTKI